MVLVGVDLLEILRSLLSFHMRLLLSLFDRLLVESRHQVLIISGNLLMHRLIVIRRRLLEEPLENLGIPTLNKLLVLWVVIEVAATTGVSLVRLLEVGVVGFL